MNLGRELEAHRKVLVELFSTTKSSIGSTPSADDRWDNEVDIFGVTIRDRLKIPIVPSG